MAAGGAADSVCSLSQWERERTSFVARLLIPLRTAMEWVNIIIQGVLIGGLYACSPPASP